MKKFYVSIIFCVFGILGVFGQSISGRVTDNNGEALMGASVVVEDLELATITDQDGLFKLEAKKDGNVKLIVSYIGFETAFQNVNFGQEQDLTIVLNENTTQLNDVIVTAQLKEESALDVPISLSVLSKAKLALINTNELNEIAGFVPGLEIQVQSTNYPSYAMRGITSELSGASDQPNVSVYFNNVPMTRGSSQVIEPYDMSRVEVLKGPQGSLFGRAAQIGAIHFLPNVPQKDFDASISAGIGEYNGYQLTGIINQPLSEKVFLRVASRVDFRDGYVNNTEGGTLMGKNTKAFRGSLRFVPSDKTNIDLQFDFQDDAAPGVAFLRKDVPNKNGEMGIFDVDASLEAGNNLSAEKTNKNYILKINHNFSDSVKLTSISSFLDHTAYESYDSDGTAARAFDANVLTESEQIYQEARLQISKDNFDITFGGSYYTEDVQTKDVWMWNEQSLFMFLLNASAMVDQNGNPVLVPALPQGFGALSGAPLPEYHAEGYDVDAKNSALELFVDGTVKLTDQFSLTAGLRYSRESLEQQRVSSLVSEDAPSTIGYFLGNAPNALLPIADLSISDDFSGVTGRFIAKYDFISGGNIYASYARGRRPNAFGYDSSTNSLYTLDEELVDSYEIGFKKKLGNTLVGLALFNQNYENFRVTTIESLSEDGVVNYKEEDIGAAFGRGIELELEHSLSNAIKLIGSYGYIKARYSDEAQDGTAQEFAGNQFRLTPDHKFAIGSLVTLPLGDNSLVFAPTYTYKSKHFFDGYNDFDVNDPDNLDNPLNHYQPAFGLLNFNLTYKVSKLNSEISVFARNLLNEKYVIDAGNLAKAINPQATTFIPGTPRIIGSRVTINF